MLSTVYTSDMVYNVAFFYTVHVVYTVEMREMREMRRTTMGRTGLRAETPFGK